MDYKTLYKIKNFGTSVEDIEDNIHGTLHYSLKQVEDELRELGYDVESIKVKLEDLYKKASELEDKVNSIIDDISDKYYSKVNEVNTELIDELIEFGRNGCWE